VSKGFCVATKNLMTIANWRTLIALNAKLLDDLVIRVARLSRKSLIRGTNRTKPATGQFVENTKACE